MGTTSKLFVMILKSNSIFLILFFLVTARASDFSRVDADVALFDATVAAKVEEFKKNPVDVHSIDWVRLKLAHMVDVDQYGRNYRATPYDRKYSREESKYFDEKFSGRAFRIDRLNTADLKWLLRVYDWFKISVFGAKADKDAWLIVQHADADLAFQKKILAVLEKLYVVGETSSENYAYLFDRVANSAGDSTQRRLQRYGTQGRCIGPGEWEAYPSEDPTNLEKRRAEMKLLSMSEYKKLFKDICK